MLVPNVRPMLDPVWSYNPYPIGCLAILGASLGGATWVAPDLDWAVA
jgi:hypothetical protein